MLEERIQNEIIASMKSKNTLRLETVRSVKAAIQKAKTEKGHTGDLSDEDIMKIIQKLVKQREESASLYEAAGRELLAQGERKEAEIMKEFLPSMMSNEEIEAEVLNIIEETGAKSLKDIGKVMPKATKAMAGRADGKMINLIVKKHLM